MSERIADDLVALHAELGVSVIRCDVVRNRVTVSLDERGAEAPAHARARLVERYGPTVEVEEGWSVYAPHTL